jgi:acyl carrier protein
MALDQDSIKTYLADMHDVDISGVASDTLLFSSGLVDSFAMIDLVTFVEAQTGASMGAADITLDNLDSIDRIVAYVQSKAA